MKKTIVALILFGMAGTRSATGIIVVDSRSSNVSATARFIEKSDRPFRVKYSASFGTARTFVGLWTSSAVKDAPHGVMVDDSHIVVASSLATESPRVVCRRGSAEKIDELEGHVACYEQRVAVRAVGEGLPLRRARTGNPKKGLAHGCALAYEGRVTVADREGRTQQV